MSEDNDIVLGRPGHEPGDAGTPLWYENQRKAMEEMNAGLADQLRAKRATPMSEAQPETVAGRALDGWIGVGLRWVDPLFPDRLGPVSVSIHDDILAIEAEARAAGAARYEAALVDLFREAGIVARWLPDNAPRSPFDAEVRRVASLLAAAPLVKEPDR